MTLALPAPIAARLLALLALATTMLGFRATAAAQPLMRLAEGYGAALSSVHADGPTGSGKSRACPDLEPSDDEIDRPSRPQGRVQAKRARALAPSDVRPEPGPTVFLPTLRSPGLSGRGRRAPELRIDGDRPAEFVTRVLESPGVRLAKPARGPPGASV